MNLNANDVSATNFPHSTNIQSIFTTTNQPPQSNLIPFPVKNVHHSADSDLSENSKPKENQITNKQATSLPPKSKKHRIYNPVEPLKSMEVINQAKEYFLNGQQRYHSSPNAKRNYMMFVLGINVGIRISDLLDFTIGHVIHENGEFKDKFYIIEKKSNKNKAIFINASAREAITTYLTSLKSYSLSDPLFKSRQKDEYGNIKAISSSMAWEIMHQMGIALRKHCGTHTLRKTMAYMMLKNNPNDPRALPMIQELLNHSSIKYTRIYLGLDEEEQREWCESNQL